MTSRWRLVNGVELYDIRQDPGQENDAAGAHPDVVARLKAFYDAWWSDLEPTFKQVPAIYLGHEAEKPVRLTGHDWITPKSTPWNQSLIRKAVNKPSATGYWNVKVATAGEYEIRLRRWPEEADTAIDAPLPPRGRCAGRTRISCTPRQSGKGG